MSRAKIFPFWVVELFLAFSFLIIVNERIQGQSCKTQTEYLFTQVMSENDPSLKCENSILIKFQLFTYRKQFNVSK